MHFWCWCRERLPRSARKTTSKFVAHSGSIWCHAGDLVRRSPDNGSIAFLGRADSQVKIRGYRVELEEIESHLARMDGVKNAVATVQLNKVSEAQELVAFIAESSPKSFDVAGCREILRRDLPYYCIPMAFVYIQAADIPLSEISGKALRNKLPHWSTMEIARSMSSPSMSGNSGDGEQKTISRSQLTTTEAILMDLFHEILGIELAISDGCSTSDSIASPAHA